MSLGLWGLLAGVGGFLFFLPPFGSREALLLLDPVDFQLCAGFALLESPKGSGSLQPWEHQDPLSPGKQLKCLSLFNPGSKVVV